MSKLRITIVTYDWPPRNSIGTHRPYSWARYWSENGQDVTVLTAKKKNFDSPLDLELPKLNGVKVIEVPYQLFLGPILKFPFIGKIGKWFRKKFVNYLGPNLDPRKAWFLATSPIFSKLARESDVVISTYGPEVAHIIGCRMKMLCPSIYWIADYRDLWSGNPSFESASKILKEKIKKDEKETVGRYADLITTVSEDMCKTLNKLHNKTTVKVTNGFDLEEKIVKKNNSKKFLKLNKTLRIVYTGAIYLDEISPVMLLDVIVNLVNKNKIPKNSITIEFYGARLDYIKNLSQQSKYLNLIKIKGHVPRPKVLEIQKKADLLLLLASSKEISRGVLSGKIFEYMASGRPILCIGGRADFEISKVLKLTSTGLVIDRYEKKKLENMIYETFNGEGIFKNYKPKTNEILKFSRKRISNNFLHKIKEKILLNKKSLKVNIVKSKKFVKKIPVITHIITGLERGGAEGFLFNLLTNGLQGPFNNRVISLMSEGYYGALLRKKKIPLSCLNLKRGQINIKAIKKLRANLIKNPPDIIQGWIHHGNFAALIGFFMTNKKSKLSWCIRVSLEIFSELKFMNRLSIKLRSLFSKIPDLILYNSTRSLLQYRDIGFVNENDFYIPNGFDIKKWKPNKNKRNKIRKLLGISKNTKVIGYVGRGDEQKDFSNLIKAFEKIKKKHSNVVLVCIGRDLKKYIINADRIIFLDQRADVHDLMTSFDLLCLCSKAEGFPNVIGEAMSSGLPCVATDVGDTKEIVDKTGWILSPGNSKLLFRFLDLALKNSQKELHQFGKKARRRIINNYSINIVKDQYISLYHSILNKK